MVLRTLLVFGLMAGMAHAEIKLVSEVEPECDACLARHNGKKALRAYLAEKRQKEEATAENSTKVTTDE
jgi:hypothetical protein